MTLTELSTDELQLRLNLPWYKFAWVGGCRCRRPKLWWLPWETQAKEKFKKLVAELKVSFASELVDRNTHH